MLPQQPIVIASVTITTDQAGRFSLNDLHKAAGAENRHQPAQFMRLDSTDALVAEMANENSDMGNPISVTRGGAAQGTYVCRELVYAYAMWISAKFHLEVIRTFDAMVTGQLPVPAATPALRLPSPAKELRAALSIAKMLGLTGNQAILSANRAVTNITGINLMDELGATHLEADSQSMLFTPTQLGKRTCINGMQFNRRLADAGLQERKNNVWVPTAKGRLHSKVLDTDKKHDSGAPVQQVKWLESVLDEVAL